MEIVVAVIAGAGVVGAAIVSGRYFQNKAIKTLNKIDILDKRVAEFEKDSAKEEG